MFRIFYMYIYNKATVLYFYGTPLAKLFLKMLILCLWSKKINKLFRRIADMLKIRDFILVMLIYL